MSEVSPEANYFENSLYQILPADFVAETSVNIPLPAAVKDFTLQELFIKKSALN